MIQLYIFLFFNKSACVCSWRRSGTLALCPVWRNSTCPVTPCASSPTTELKFWRSLETVQQRYTTSTSSLFTCRDTQPVATCFSLCAVTVTSSNISNAKVNDQHHKHCFSLLVAASAANAGTANITTATNIENGHTNTTAISCYTCFI